MSICQIAFAIAQIAFVDVAASHKNEWAGYVLSKQGERERERESLEFYRTQADLRYPIVN